MADQLACALDECRKIFLELSLFWRLSLAGFVALLGMGCGVFVYSQNCYNADKERMVAKIERLEAAFKDIAVIRDQNDKVLANQDMMVEYFKIPRKRYQK